jgi:hypothetical protein
MDLQLPYSAPMHVYPKLGPHLPLGDVLSAFVNEKIEALNSARKESVFIIKL